MSCRDLDSFVLPYLDGELEAEERADIERHLAGCAACAEHIHSEAAFRDALRGKIRQSLAEQRAPEGLRQRIRHGIRAERRREDLMRWATGGAAAAAVAVVVAGSVFIIKQQQRDRVVHDAAARFFKPPPGFDLPSPAHAAVEAFSSAQLERGVRLPQIQNAVVKGARASNIADKAAVLVAYDVSEPAGEARRAQLYVVDDSHGDVPADRLPAVQLAKEKGVNVVVWGDDGILYVLASDLQESDIRAMLKPKAEGATLARLPEVPISTRPVSLDAMPPASFPPAFQQMPQAGGFQPASFQPR